MIASLFAGIAVVLSATGRAGSLRHIGTWRLTALGLAVLIVIFSASYLVVNIAVLFVIIGLVLGLIARYLP